MLRNLGYSTVSNLSRFLASGVLFIVLAASWPPELFGRFVFHHVMALGAAMAVDYGLAVKTMRDVARSPDAAQPILLSTLGAQLRLVPVSGLVGVAFWSLGIVDQPALFALLWLAHVLFNLVNTSYGAFRGIGRFDAEAQLALVGNMLFFALPLVMVSTDGSLEAVAIGMVAARLLQAAVGAARLRFLPGTCGERRLPQMRILRGAHAYALESWASVLFQHADSLLVRLVLGEAALGIYQAGARFLVIAIILVQSLGNLLVPSLTAALSDWGAFRHVVRGSTAAFAVLGIASLIGLALLGGPVARFVYGDAYAGVASLMPLFGLVALLRCIAASQGFALLALGQQSYRSFAVLAALAVFVPAGLVGASLGVSGVIWANALAVSVLLALYAWRLQKALPAAAGTGGVNSKDTRSRRRC